MLVSLIFGAVMVIMPPLVPKDPPKESPTLAEVSPLALNWYPEMLTPVMGLMVILPSHGDTRALK